MTPEFALNMTVITIIFSVVIVNFLFGVMHSLSSRPNNQFNSVAHLLSGFIAIGQASLGIVACIVITSFYDKIDALPLVLMYIMLPTASTAVLRYYPEQAKQFLESLINRFTQGKP